MSKTCVKCNKTKPYEEYHKNKAKKDGYLNVCKPCRKLEQQEYRKTVKGKARDRKYNNSSKRYTALYSYWDKFPEKKHCQDSLSRAIRDGKVLKNDSCEVCESKINVQGHHWRCSEETKLDVFWLCSSCHSKEHENIKEFGYPEARFLYILLN